MDGLLSGDGNDEEIGMLDEAVDELQEYSKEVSKNWWISLIQIKKT